MSARAGVRVRMAAADRDQVAKLKFYQMWSSAVAGVLADRTEICRAYCLRISMTRSGDAPRVSNANGKK